MAAPVFRRSSPLRLQRIQQRSQFQSLRVTRFRGSSGPIRVAFVPMEENHHVALAFAIGRKVGNAVRRNRLRRRLRSVFADRMADIPSGLYLVIASHGACELPFLEVKERFLEAVQRATERKRR